MKTEKSYLISIYWYTWNNEDLEIGETDKKGTSIEDQKMVLSELADLALDYGPFEYCANGWSENSMFWFCSVDHFDDPDKWRITEDPNGELTYYHLFVQNLDGSNVTENEFKAISKIVLNKE